MIYTAGSVAAVLAAVALDLWAIRSRLVTTGVFWVAYAIILFFQLIMNGLLTGIPIVTYDPSVHVGIPVANAPVEDIGFGFGLVLVTLATWHRLGARERAASEGRPPPRP